jgi:hypothetical protein
MTRPCQETAGFLFSHPCSRAATTQCGRCQKAICDRHCHATQDALLCTSCARQARALLDDPYFYWSYYGDDWDDWDWDWDDDDDGPGAAVSQGAGDPGAVGAGSAKDRDEDDFTEADGQSTGGEGRDFEKDTGAS